MSKLSQYLLSGLMLLGLGGIWFLLEKLQKRTGLRWKEYPGFSFLPAQQRLREACAGEQGAKKRAILLMMLGAAFLGGALELALLNTLPETFILRKALLALPVAFLFLQWMELGVFLLLLSGKESFRLYRISLLLKWLPLLLCLLGLFASLFLQGTKL